MWFRNLILHRLHDWPHDSARLEECLARQAFQGCGQMDMESRGWISPSGSGDALVHSSAGHMLIALGVENKLLPASVVRQYALARADELEARQGYRPGRKQMRDLQDRITDELLPRAFTRRSITYAWIDPANGWLVVDAANIKKAESLLEVLRRNVDPLPLSTLQTKVSPGSAMTGWLAAGDAPSGFTIDRDCELLSRGEDKAAVRYVRHPLESARLRGHISEGKQATRLALTWQDRLSFVLTDTHQVKRLQFLDMLKEQNDQQAQTPEEQFDADFAIMTGELARFLPDLLDALGGVSEGP